VSAATRVDPAGGQGKTIIMTATGIFLGAWVATGLAVAYILYRANNKSQ